MHPLTTFVRSLGNAGALANAQAMLDARRREDSVVELLAHRLDTNGRASTPAAEATTSAA